MNGVVKISLLAWLCVQGQMFATAPKLTPGNVTVGRNLQTYTTISLSEPATADMEITLTSADPGRLLLSRVPDAAGAPSITLKVKARFRESPEYWLHALADAGQVAYTVSAPGTETAKGLVTLTPSGIAIAGPFGANVPEFKTTPRAWPSRITVRAVRLDPSLKPVEQQYVRGGLALDFKVVSSNPAAGSVDAPVHIDPANDSAVVQFRPAGMGTTKLTLAMPPGFSVPAEFASVTVIVNPPGMAVADDMVIGENLQIGAALSLGEPAPDSGVEVKITSSDPRKLLLSASATEPGNASISIKMPPGSAGTTYYLQALASEGTVTNTVSAPGYVSRTGTIHLAPSGVILLVPGHGPDEAELLRPETAGHKQNMFVALLSEHRDTPLALYTAYMNPVSRRTADITVQALRPGMTAHVKLENTNPDVGTIDTHVIIQGGTEKTLVSFKPLKPGQTVVSVLTPEGFAKPSNATEFLAVVRE